MNKYELALVVNAKIEDEARENVVNNVKDIITKFGGEIKNVDAQGLKRMAYEIQKMKDAYYYFIQFDAEANVPAEIETRVRIAENVLRFLCVRLDEE